MSSKENNETVARVWARRKEYPNYASWVEGRNYSARDNRLYSFATCIAEIVTIKNKTVYAVSDTRFSSATDRHQAYMWRAIPEGSIVIKCGNRRGDIGVLPYMDKLLRQNGHVVFEYSLDKAEEAYASAQRARKYKDIHMQSASKWLEHARLVKKLFGLRSKIPDISKLSEVRKKARKRELARYRAAQRTAEKDWRSGKFVQYEHMRKFKEVILRVSGDVVETSTGYSISIHEAKRLLKLLKAGQLRLGERVYNPVDVLDFEVRSITRGDITIGCQRIPMSEIKNLEKEL